MIRFSTFLLSFCLAVTGWAQTRKTCLDRDWQFHYGAIAYAGGTMADDIQWRTLDLPHDWSVETEAAQAAGGMVVGPFSTNSTGQYQTGFTVGGEGWYRKTFTLDSANQGERVWLYFEGAYNQSDVWVNGRHVHWNHYGYQPFRFDITDCLLPTGEPNEMVVRVCNQGQNTRWYAGSGIYRHVWLLRMPSVYLDEWASFVRADAEGRVVVSAQAVNTTSKKQSATLQLELKDAQGTVVATAQKTAEIAAQGEASVSHTFVVDNPRLWSPQSPSLYQVRFSLKGKGGTDVLEKRLGMRSLQFSAEQGFLLNGVPTLLRGGCVHHDNGLLGAAAWDRAEDRKLQLLKDQGFNAVRCSHNMPSEHFLDACDSLGLMVIDECFDQWLNKKNDNDYSQYFPQFFERDLTTMVTRDRSHPSVIMWSIGNEIPGRTTDAGMAVAARLTELCHQLDPTRPTTAAVCGWDEGDAWNSASQNWSVQDTRAFESLDVGGYNYLWDKYERDHATHPQRVICGLESYAKHASQNWDLVEKHPYVIGDFVWTAMDYLGEAGIGYARSDRQPSMFQQWPVYNGYCGDIDLIGQKKPQSYFRDVVWGRLPIAMAVQPTASYNNWWGWQLEEQSWTWRGREGDTVAVNVYSKAPQVRLYLNGESMGDAAPGDTYWAGFRIPYQPGTLRAVNLDADGRETDDAAFELQTTGEPVALRLAADRNRLQQGGQDLGYVMVELVDDQGRVCTSDTGRRVSISVDGQGLLLAAGNASPEDMESFRSATPRLWRGRALAIVRSGDQLGEIRVRVESEGLPSQTLILQNGAL